MKNDQGRRIIKVLIAKTSLDGHIRGPIVVSRALRDAGIEVIYGGMLTAEQIISAAAEEYVDVIGLNIGGRYGAVKRVMDLIHRQHMGHILVIAGGSIPPQDIPTLKEWGIKEAFPPGSSLESIVTCIKENLTRQSRNQIED